MGERNCELVPVLPWQVEVINWVHPYLPIALVLEAPHPVNVEILREALRWLMDRHEALRTTLVEDEGVWKQKIASQAPELSITEASNDDSGQGGNEACQETLSSAF